MKKINKLAIAVLSAAAVSSANAADLGEINGTKFSVGGYIKAEGVFNDPDAGDSSFDGTARESRVNFKATKEVNGHKVTAFVEGDFWGDFHTNSSYNWRLRHAFVQVDNVTVGQTWNGQFWAVAPLDGEMMNFWGLGAGTIAGNGARVRRDVVLHYTNAGFRFSAQDPIYLDSDTPDLVLSYTKKLESGSAYNVALTGREVQNGTGSDYGVGISAAAKLLLGSSSQLRVSAYAGEGMGVYSGVCVGGAWVNVGDANCDAEGGSLVDQTGYAVAYRHQFNSKLRSTVRYGEVNVDDVADTNLEMTTANLIYTYLPNLDLGVEWRDQNIDTLAVGPFAGARPAGNQLEIMAKYRF